MTNSKNVERLLNKMQSNKPVSIKDEKATLDKESLKALEHWMDEAGKDWKNTEIIFDSYKTKLIEAITILSNLGKSNTTLKIFSEYCEATASLYRTMGLIDNLLGSVTTFKISKEVCQKREER